MRHKRDAGEVDDVVWTHFLNDLFDSWPIGQVSFINMSDAGSFRLLVVNDAMDLMALKHEKLGNIASGEPGDSRNESACHVLCPLQVVAV
jgi:hypothetical protein